MIGYGPKFEASNHDQIELCGYTDADWAGDVVTRKSASGYVFQIGKSNICWRSNRQSVTALSFTEAEYISLCAGAQETTWLRRLLCSVGFMIADILTKGLPKPKFEELRLMLRVTMVH